MSGDIPSGLKAALGKCLEGLSRKTIARHSAAISEGYRSGRPSRELIGADEAVLAYLLARMPATYAAVARVLSEARERAPDFAPRSLLDAGAGPGTASWASVETWSGIARIAMLDDSAAFLRIAQNLAAASAHDGLRTAQMQAGDMAQADAAIAQADLVIASYALAELAHDRLPQVVARLWNACSGMLVLIEPGTPAGFSRILACRDMLLKQGAAILAPCPASSPCPVLSPDWCHFSVRLARSRDHMITKSAQVPFEDERFSYLVAARDGVAATRPAARVLALPKRNKTGVTMKLCTGGRIEMRTVASRDRANFAHARNADWGDPLD